MNNKKGISAVVATVLIILITVAAVTIIWAAIIPLIQGQLDTTTACLDAQTEVIINNEFTCKNSDGSVDLQIKRGASEISLSDVQVILYSGGDSGTLTLLSSNISKLNDLPSANSAQVFEIDVGNVTQALGAGKPVTDVQIAPIVTEGNTEQTCPAGQVIKLREC